MTMLHFQVVSDVPIQSKEFLQGHREFTQPRRLFFSLEIEWKKSTFIKWKTAAKKTKVSLTIHYVNILKSDSEYVIHNASSSILSIALEPLNLWILQKLQWW